MAVRRSQVQQYYSSSTRATQSYYPFYPPPTVPVGAVERGGYSGFGTVPGSYVDERTDKGVVSARWNRAGEVDRYTHGGVIQRVMRMIATGQVEQSQAQTIQSFPSFYSLNGWLYRAATGYPRNLGLSEKVPTLPNEVLNPQVRMQPAPRITRNVFTRRRYTTAPSVPAEGH